jgi:hypothetical protein
MIMTGDTLKSLSKERERLFSSTPASTLSSFFSGDGGWWGGERRKRLLEIFEELAGKLVGLEVNTNTRSSVRNFRQ